MNRYTSVQRDELLKNGYVFAWPDLFRKPLREFLSRYFAGEGYKDGVHGLGLCFLQMFSELMLYLKVWQKQGFKPQELKKKELKNEFKQAIKELNWWLRKELGWLKFLRLP
jgi:(heptosyl)LPS beta-1,4-glucosyltransferase